ncbi:MAG: hypothetical protein ABJZ55_24875 [Fuerstiella sp.]
MRAAAFMTRSIRQDSRTISHHLMRAAVAAFILFLFMMQVSQTTIQIGAGGNFAAQVFQCCYWFLTLLGGVHFSAAISEEKEEQTLPLLKMTGASGFAILLGKSLPRLSVAVLFLICVAPFLLLSVTLGGVLIQGLVSSILSVLFYSLMLSQLGLLASVLAKNSRRAFSMMFFFWSLTEQMWLWVMLVGGLELVSSQTYGVWYDHAFSSSLFMNLNLTLLGFAEASWWYPHMTVHLGVSVCAFVLSWLSFNRFTEERSSGASSNWMNHLVSANHRSRVWDRATAWKTWHVLTGGVRWLWIRALGGIVLSFGLVTAVVIAVNGSFQAEAICIGSFWIALIVFLLSVGRMTGLVYQTEIQQKTLSTLVMLPAPASETFLSMLKGMLPAIAASFVPVIVGFVAMLSVLMEARGNFQSNVLSDIVEIIVVPWFWHFFSWALVTLALGTYLSTRVRHGGLLIAIGLLWVIAPIMFGLFFGIVVGSSNAREFFEYVVPVMLITVELAMALILMRSTFSHLEQLAAR